MILRQEIERYCNANPDRIRLIVKAACGIPARINLVDDYYIMIEQGDRNSLIVISATFSKHDDSTQPGSKFYGFYAITEIGGEFLLSEYSRVGVDKYNPDHKGLKHIDMRGIIEDGGDLFLKLLVLRA